MISMAAEVAEGHQVAGLGSVVVVDAVTLGAEAEATSGAEATLGAEAVAGVCLHACLAWPVFPTHASASFQHLTVSPAILTPMAHHDWCRFVQAERTLGPAWAVAGLHQRGRLVKGLLLDRGGGPFSSPPRMLRQLWNRHLLVCLQHYR